MKATQTLPHGYAVYDSFRPSQWKRAICSWHLPRNKFLVANLAPVCVITAVGLLLLPLVSQTSISLLVFLTAMNFAGSISDIASSVYLLSHAPTTYLDTDGTIYTKDTPGTECVSMWRRRIRSIIEMTLAKLA